MWAFHGENDLDQISSQGGRYWSGAYGPEESMLNGFAVLLGCLQWQGIESFHHEMLDECITHRFTSEIATFSSPTIDRRGSRISEPPRRRYCIKMTMPNILSCRVSTSP